MPTQVNRKIFPNVLVFFLLLDENVAVHQLVSSLTAAVVLWSVVFSKNLI